MHLGKKKLIDAIEAWNDGEHTLDQIAKRAGVTKYSLSLRFTALRRRGVKIRYHNEASVLNQEFVDELKNRFGSIPDKPVVRHYQKRKKK